MKATRIALMVIGLVVPTLLVSQEREDRTLLTQAQMTAIINEVSGERAMHHVLELVPYQRVRLPEEYNGPYRESRVIADFAKQYGFSNVSIETFGTGRIPDADIQRLIEQHFDLRPAGIISALDLRRPIYRQTAAYGHFGRLDIDLPWERTNKAAALAADAGIAEPEPVPAA